MTTPLHFSRSASSLARRAASRHASRFAVLIALAPASVRAHQGDHGADWLHALMHLLTEPDHLAAILLAGATACFGARRLWKRASAARSRDSAGR